MVAPRTNKPRWKPGGDRWLRPDHLLTFANITTFQLSKVNLLDWLRLDSPADSFEEFPGGWSRCRSCFQVGVLSPKATAGYNDLFQPGALVMQAVGGSYLYHMMVAGHHNWCRKLHTGRPATARWRAWDVSPGATTAPMRTRK